MISDFFRAGPYLDCPTLEEEELDGVASLYCDIRKNMYSRITKGGVVFWNDEEKDKAAHDITMLVMAKVMNVMQVEQENEEEE